MSEEDLIDEEILEIFVEEAGEVLETINEYFPQWRADPSNDDARTTVRRSFHTLKGSGRMVQAYEIGELAWSIENMLNRVLDGTIETSDGLFNLIQQVVDLVPSMVKSFEERTPITVNVQPLMNAADLYSKGQTPAPVNMEAASAPAETSAAEEVVNMDDAQFKQDVTHRLDELAKVVHQLSMAVKGINSELPNVKGKIREIDARPTPIATATGGASPEVAKDLFIAKQEIAKLRDMVEAESDRSHRLFDEIKSYNNSVNKELETQRKKAATLSQELTAGIEKIRTETGAIAGSIKGWAIGAAGVAAVVAIAVGFFV